jgi:uncharacterized protein (TIGR00297 family)
MNEFVSGAIAVAAAIAIAFVAYRKQTLSTDGAIAAAAVGALIVIGADWWGGVILLTFFVTSSALSLIRARQGDAQIDRHSRGHQRDAVQVLANGGVATAFALLFGLIDKPWAFGGFAGAIAAANADTWATEIGRMKGHNPRMLLSRKPVAPGASGGVTLAGILASLGGALSVGIVGGIGVAIGAVDISTSTALMIVALAIGGFVGSSVDSALGETVQAVYFCPFCQVETEDRVHNCGSETKLVRGFRVFNNDVVNACATLSGALVALLLTL